MPLPVQCPWRDFAASGVGSLPGTRSREAARIVAGELPDLPHVPELPARGPGADLIGRTSALLAGVSADLALETTTTGWRFAAAPGAQARRAASWLAEDLDAVEEQFAGYAGPVKAALAGPWTLAATVELASGERALRDAGAARDLAAALAVAVADHVRDLARRLPAAQVLLQLDEPALPAVVAGAIPTQSGLGRHRPVDAPVAQAALGTVLAAAVKAGARPLVHCCGPRPPVGLLRAAGAVAVSFDLTAHERADDDALGEALESGVGLLLGLVPAQAGVEPGHARAVGERSARAVRGLAERLGLPLPALGPLIAITPTCGLAGASPGHARGAYDACREVGRLLREDEAEAPVEPGAGPGIRRGLGGPQ